MVSEKAQKKITLEEITTNQGGGRWTRKGVYKKDHTCDWSHVIPHFAKELIDAGSTKENLDLCKEKKVKSSGHFHGQHCHNSSSGDLWGNPQRQPCRRIDKNQPQSFKLNGMQKIAVWLPGGEILRKWKIPITGFYYGLFRFITDITDIMGLSLRILLKKAPETQIFEENLEIQADLLRILRNITEYSGP